ncbi:MAG: hypothetical protein NT062_17280 [Proteobacteria bacterium]|nr:hypothetical protein [Pseudomonadota bacterium]
MRWLVPLLLVGCHHPTAPHPTAPPVVGGSSDHAETLRATLEREVGAGRAVAILGGLAGVRAVSSDGARMRMLAPGPVSWVEVDLRGDAIWYGIDDEVRVLDLQAAAPESTVVITGLPFARHQVLYDLAPPHVQTPEEREHEAEMETLGLNEMMESAMGRPFDQIEVWIRPHGTSLVSRGSRIDGMEESNAKFAADVKAAKLVGQAVFEKLAARAAHRHVVTRDPPADKRTLRVAGIDPARCDQTSPDDCGSAEAIVGTHYWRVTTQTACGDGCGRMYGLYDSDTKQLLPEADWTDMREAWVAKDGSAFLANGRVVNFATGPLAATPKDDSSGGGWLDGGYFYDL